MPVVQFVWDQTSGLCSDCWLLESPTRIVEVMNAGRVAVLPRVSPKKKARQRAREARRIRPPSLTESAVRAAKLSAMRRLKNLYPAMFAMLYDEERAKRGLPPLIRRETPDYRSTVAETLAFERVYDALQTSGEPDA